MQKEIVEAAPHAELAVELVWIPMVPTDSLRAANRAARMFKDPRIRQFYDGERLLGRAYMTDVFPDCIRDAIGALPEGDEMRERLEEYAAVRDGPLAALWDVVLAYPPDAKWEGKIPRPAYWSKQINYWKPGNPGEATGTFWRNDCKLLPTDSDWADEVRTILQSILQKS